MKLTLLAPLLVTATFAAACAVDQYCYADKDCLGGQVCRAGACTAAPDAAPPPDGLSPDGLQPMRCLISPMVLARRGNLVFCVDPYEASRPDATPTSAGVNNARAVTRAGVLPWMVNSNSQADAACAAAGKRLCSSQEWGAACSGPAGTTYAYGNFYNPTTCNGVDTYPNWQFKLMPTGSFSGCTNAFGVFDMNGNVWEHVRGGDDMLVRGGAFNCSDSTTFHRCDYVPTNWTPSALGFRCCADAVANNADAGAPDTRVDLPPPDLTTAMDAAMDAAAEGGPDA